MNSLNEKFADIYTKQIIKEAQRPNASIGIDKIAKGLIQNLIDKKAALSDDDLLEVSKDIVNYVYFISPQSEKLKENFKEWLVKTAIPAAKTSLGGVPKGQLAYFMVYYMFLSYKKRIFKLDIEIPIIKKRINTGSLEREYKLNKYKVNVQENLKFDKLYNSIISEATPSEATPPSEVTPPDETNLQDKADKAEEYIQIDDKAIRNKAIKQLFKYVKNYKKHKQFFMKLFSKLEY